MLFSYKAAFLFYDPQASFQETHVAVELVGHRQTRWHSDLGKAGSPLLAVCRYAVNWTDWFQWGLEYGRCYLLQLAVKISSMIRTQAYALQNATDLKPPETRAWPGQQWGRNSTALDSNLSLTTDNCVSQATRHRVPMSQYPAPFTRRLSGLLELMVVKILTICCTLGASELWES